MCADCGLVNFILHVHHPGIFTRAGEGWHDVLGERYITLSSLDKNRYFNYTVSFFLPVLFQLPKGACHSDSRYEKEKHIYRLYGTSITL